VLYWWWIDAWNFASVTGHTASCPDVVIQLDISQVRGVDWSVWVCRCGGGVWWFVCEE